MANPLSLALYVPSPERKSRLSAAAAATPKARIVAAVSDLDALRAVVHQERPAALLVDLEDEPKQTLDAIEMLPAPRPVLLVVGPQEDSQLILRVLRLGAREFFPPEISNGAVGAALERLHEELRPSAACRTRAPLVAVTGAKGGVGSTVTACQLAVSLQRGGARTAIVDLSLLQGDVALYLDAQPRYTLADLGGEIADLDASYLDPILHAHRSGLEILAAPTAPDRSHLVSEQHVERALDLLRDDFAWVLVDVPSHWDDLALRALELADQVLLVTVREVAPLHHARQRLALLERLGIPREKIRLVANRASRTDPIRERDMDRFLETRVDASLPNDFMTVSRSLNAGETLAEAAKASSLGAAYESLAHQLHAWCEVEGTNGNAPSRGWQQRLLGLVRKHGNR